MRLDPVSLSNFTRQGSLALAKLSREQRKSDELVLSELKIDDDAFPPFAISLMIKDGYLVVDTKLTEIQRPEEEPLYEIVGKAGIITDLLQNGSVEATEKAMLAIVRAVQDSIEGTIEPDYLLARSIIAKNCPFRIVQSPAEISGYKPVKEFRRVDNIDIATQIALGYSPIKTPSDDIADDFILQLGPKKSTLRVSRDAA